MMLTANSSWIETAGAGNAVRVSRVVPDTKPPVLRYEPGNPDADSKGYVAYPAVDPVEEMADLLGAVRAYELNASAVQATKGMIQQSLDLAK
jgi:flagellar basal-body rod protein FlgC